ncbi:hypothetical protein, partial [Klebsiella pneumoniae]|uniref:hypothetical protein n=1 Tax=Klebsiella pneumoniae TaxID=573 RepID=UPI001CEC089F
FGGSVSALGLTRRGARRRGVSGRSDQAQLRFVAGWRLAPYAASVSCHLPLMSSPRWLKLPVLVASKSLRRSRKAGAARMDAA